MQAKIEKMGYVPLAAEILQQHRGNLNLSDVIDGLNAIYEQEKLRSEKLEQIRSSDALIRDDQLSI